jgi:predicted DNA-binding antitoxin AbrB/MazE fold protein
MTITVEATYEGGVLKPARPLPLAEHAQVEVTIQTPRDAGDEPAALSPEKQAALQRFLSLELPVADWPTMEDEIIRGAIE